MAICADAVNSRVMSFAIHSQSLRKTRDRKRKRMRRRRKAIKRDFMHVLSGCQNGQVLYPQFWWGSKCARILSRNELL